MSARSDAPLAHVADNGQLSELTHVSRPGEGHPETIAWMGSLSWSEIRNRAITFSREWADAKSERAEKQSFWNDFFQVYGVSRRAFAAFEAPVRKVSGRAGSIDLFWRGRLLVEHKSRGEDLSPAESQAFGYVEALTSENRQDEIPRYVILSDFETIALFDLESDAPRKAKRIRVRDLHQHVRDFAFMVGQEPARVDPEDPANIRAFDLMCKLHDELEAGGLKGHHLERLLVRVLFCLFAEDTGLFKPETFTNFLTGQTREDGSDLGARLNHFFWLLDQPTENRQGNLDPDLAGLPYVNGQLFKERLDYPTFTGAMRNALIACARFYWARISPAVFGSLFQGVLDSKERRQQGAHYTSERDIMRCLRSLALDDLRAEFESLKSDRSTRRASNLEAMHQKLRTLRFLDPACGCGNFLVLAYREIRALELEIILEITKGQQVTDLRNALRVDVDQFYGIERDEWPARIAEVALWLMDHQMNLEASKKLGRYFERLPLVTAPRITVGNALEIPWGDVLQSAEASFILGNPPYVGKAMRTADQQGDMDRVWRGVPGHGVLDYVTCWYRLAAEYAEAKATRVAFVSTNSITHGEQVGLLWSDLFKKRMKIHFAHRTFPWRSEARGAAHVHVVIIGFGAAEAARKLVYDYDIAGTDAGTEGTVSRATNISPYLIEGRNLCVMPSTAPICAGVSPMSFGNMPNDGGHLLLSTEQRDQLISDYPDASAFVRPFVGPQEFIDGNERWCLWLNGVDPAAIRKIRPILSRVDAVRRIRSESSRPATNALARTPAIFGEIRQPTTRYVGVPKTSGERRTYIPIAFFEPEIIASTDLLTVEGATYYEFGVMCSLMHMSWVRTVGGRLESRYRYSATLVYNTFPWPQVDGKGRAAVEAAAKKVEVERKRFLVGETTIADLYDPLTMPSELLEAHASLDRVVERCYRAAPFRSERERLEQLMTMYEQLRAESPKKVRATVAKTRVKKPAAAARPGAAKTYPTSPADVRAVADSARPPKKS